MRSKRFGILAGGVLAIAALAAAQGPHPVQVETRVWAEMRDGVKLAADVYRPESGGPFPVLLTRTPYDRRGGANQARELASHGYIVVVQDTRGRYSSEGEFYPFRHESDDGYDTVEWAAAARRLERQSRYVSADRMSARPRCSRAIANPPHLTVSMFPYVTASEYYDGWTYQSGALMQWFASSWTSGLIQDTLRREGWRDGRPASNGLGSLPVDDFALMAVPTPDQLAPYYDDWVEHETDDEYWQRWKISDHYQDMERQGAARRRTGTTSSLKGSIKNYTGIGNSRLPMKVVREAIAAVCSIGSVGACGNIGRGQDWRGRLRQADAVLDMHGHDSTLSPTGRSKTSRTSTPTIRPVRMFRAGRKRLERR